MQAHRIDEIPLEVIIQMFLGILKHIFCKANDPLINDFRKLLLCIEGQSRITIKRFQVDMDVGHNELVDGFLVKPLLPQQRSLIPDYLIQIIWKIVGIPYHWAFRSFIRYQGQHGPSIRVSSFKRSR